MKVELKSQWSGSVLFSIEADSWRLAVEAAVRSGADLCDANLCGADLRDANLCDADLCDADLRGADLRGANLGGANLCDANLCDADLRDANLRGANLGGTDLRGADLRGANLRGANLCGADLRGANLRGAKGIEKFPIQIFGHKHFIQTTQEGNLRIGCEEHSFDEWREIAETLGATNGYSPVDVEIYKAHIEHVEKISRLLWNAKKRAEKEAAS